MSSVKVTDGEALCLSAADKELSTLHISTVSIQRTVNPAVLRYITDNVTFQHLHSIFAASSSTKLLSTFSQAVITLPVNLHSVHLTAVYGPKTMAVSRVTFRPRASVSHRTVKVKHAPLRSMYFE